MPFLVPLLIGALIDVCASLVGRVLLALGLSFVTYVGFDALLTVVKAQIVSNLSASGVSSFLSFMFVDKGLSMIFSAVAVSLAIKGLSAGGALTKMLRR